MKSRMILISVVAMLVAFCSVALADNPTTITAEVKAVRTAVAVADTNMTVYDANHWVTVVGTKKANRPAAWNAGVFEMYADANENTEIPYIAFAKWGGTYGHFEPFAIGSFFVGKQAVTHHPVGGAVSTAHWCDSATNTIAEMWITDVSIKDTGHDRIVKLKVDFWPGVEDVTFWFPTLPASTTVWVVWMGG